MAAFFSPSKKLMTEEEKIKILNFALEISKNRKFKKLFLKNDIKEILKNHYLAEKIKSLKEKYSFLGKMFFSGEPFSLEYYFDQISDCLKMGEKDIKTKLKETKEARKQNTKKKKEIIRKYNVKDKKILGLIKLASEISFYRNWRLEIANKSIFFVLPLLNEIAKRLKITYQDLIQLTPKEIICCLKEGMISKKFKNLIASRKKGFAVIEVKNKVKILTGKDLEKIKNKLKISYEKTKLIKGISANPGNITGKCVIINSPKDFKKVEKGSIIVTKMTTTEFVPVLKKSKGLITDIGGLTSHAAIVSRELNIPCIIGTKIATKVLKDGNLVEVDAEKGVVKILES
jgi:phosphoenolpyruvate synthase/pyruvate phosphate dikinase